MRPLLGVDEVRIPDLRINSPDWTVQRSRSPATRGGPRDTSDAKSGFPEKFLTDDSKVAEEFTAQPQRVTRDRGAAPGPLDFSYEVGPGESAVWPFAIRPAR
jgi:hypothetical protein